MSFVSRTFATGMRVILLRQGGPESVTRRPVRETAPDRIAATMSEETKYGLPESAIPRQWVNLLADLPPGSPPLHPGTKEPVGPDDLAPIFPMSLIEQEV